MTYWILKLANQNIYPEQPGETYVYDNTRSINVRSGDIFIFLDKRQRRYSFSGTGRIEAITERDPTADEMSRNPRIRIIYSARISEMVWFEEPLEISPSLSAGRRNRSRLGIFNALAWGGSISNIDEIMYREIMNLIQEQGLLPLLAPSGNSDDDDKLGPSQQRRLGSFSEKVLDRHRHTCAVCGTKYRPVLIAGHLSPYSSDRKNRRNLANGICLCTFCHTALDRKQIALKINGEIIISPEIEDKVALQHFTRIDSSTRRNWIVGIDEEFLKITEHFYYGSHGINAPG